MFEEWNFKLCRDGSSCDNCQKIFGLGRNDYWSRMWIIQEVSLAKAPVIYYGMDIVLWQDVISAITQNSDNWFRSFAAPAFLWVLELQRHDLPSKGGMVPLSDAVESSWASQCSEPRDMLYALQGLVLQNVRVPIDYSRPILEVYLDGVVMLLRECYDNDGPTAVLNLNISKLTSSMMLKELDPRHIHVFREQHTQDRKTMSESNALASFRYNFRSLVLAYVPPKPLKGDWPRQSRFSSG